MKGSENTFGKFESIWMLTSAGMRVSARFLSQITIPGLSNVGL